MGEMRTGARIGRRALTCAAIAGATLLVAGASLSPATATGRSGARPLGLFQPLAGESIPVHGGTVDSLNWSGYVVTPSAPVTNVSSTFTVPTAGLLPPGFTAAWTGIGGYASGSTDLIQAGVGEQSLPSAPLLSPKYYAWIETLPDPEQPIQGCTGDQNCAVNPGDVVTVIISNNTDGDIWSISMSDAGHWSYSTTLTYQSSRSSAEWILEAPTVAAVQTIPAPVGTARFGPTSTFNGQSIATGNPTTIDMGLGIGLNEATPSPLGGPSGESFNVCTYASSCPAP